MLLRRGVVLGLLAVALVASTTAVLYELAEARQRPIAVVRFLLGYFDRRDKFVATHGRGATNVDRNSIVMFVFSGAVAMGRNQKASLPQTLAERSENADVGDIFEPGVIPTKPSPFVHARIVAAGSINTDTVVIAAPTAGGGETLARGVFFKVPRPRNRRRVFRNRVSFNPRFVAATFNNPTLSSQ